MTAPVDGGTSQGFGDNPTANLPADSWLIQTFGNYQPNGHTGVDFPVPVGTPVRAVAAGTVKHVGWYSGSYADNPYWIAPAFAGFVLVIDHGAFIGIYAHLSSSPISEGQQVDEGQIVAYSGNTGGSTGPHLHFEVLPDGWDFNNGMYGRINPAPFLFGGIAAQGSITHSTEAEDDMACVDADRLNQAVDRILGVIDRPNAKVLTMDDLGAIADAVLDDATPLPGGGTTTPRTKVTYQKQEFDANQNLIKDLAGKVEALTVIVAELAKKGAV
jgi:hypothetical protein